ncbi:hypothetical protein JOF41_006976 [Saccharothrix coeruleofusca]|uniref:type IV toxin-antitoxin system AbiEi family antitoxin n=1 Tax=Saccharothrix coeruleofusca TaxID=33919 RepID=UPI001AE503BA|nr:hypothetical protein [Saccharothrix coeruleofusca]MBP2340798.1 hypothetical protein [Saccharothrix coeruleofusca]
MAHQPNRGRRAGRADARLVLTAPDGTSTVVLIESKAAVTPRDVAAVAARIESYRTDDVGGAILVAPFVSPRTRARLAEHGLGWFDATGNLRLAIDRPAVFIDRAGADRSGFRDPADRLLKSLRGPAAAKVVLELCETALPVGVRELAERAGVGAASSARVLDLLDREAVVERGEGGAVVAVRKRALVGRWVEDYRLMSSNEVVPALDPRGVNHALTAMSGVGGGVAVTGSAAARAYLPEGVTPLSPLVSLSLYAEDPVDLMTRLGLRRVERGANVLVARPYDEVVHEKARLVGGIRCAAPAQVVADLLTGPGRSSEEAEHLVSALGWAS